MLGERGRRARRIVVHDALGRLAGRGGALEYPVVRMGAILGLQEKPVGMPPDEARALGLEANRFGPA